jgi:Zn-dependent M28 family amino/carboxypeptidase
MLSRIASLLAASFFAVALHAADFNGQRALDDVKRAVAFGPRPAGSEASRQMQAWIVQELKAQGWEVVEDRFTARTPAGDLAMTNLIAKKPGLTGRTVAISGHTDTKRFPFRFVGANDGGSSTAVLLELARSLKDQRFRNDIWLVFFDGEEAVRNWTETDSLYGSRHLAARMASDGSLARLLALINVDMIGDRDLHIIDEDSSTPFLRQYLHAAAAKLGYSRHVETQPESIDDDHVPFLQRGAHAIDLIDFDYGPRNSYWHTAQDTPDKLSAQSLKITGSLVVEMLHMLEPHDGGSGGPGGSVR